MTLPQDAGTELHQAHPDMPSPAQEINAADRGVPAPESDVGPTFRTRPAWAIFVGLAAVVLAVDQVSKTWVIATIEPGSVIRILGDLVRLLDSRNNGALFGLFESSAPVFAVASIAVIGLIVVYHARSRRNLLLSIALGLLLGGALGNLVDRIRYGFVVDWVDIGLGNVRWWTFNIGDAAISLAIVLLLILAIRPNLGAATADA